MEPSDNSLVSLHRILEGKTPRERRALLKATVEAASRYGQAFWDTIERQFAEGSVSDTIAWGALEVAADDKLLKSDEGRSLLRIREFVQSSLRDLFDDVFLLPRSAVKDLARELSSQRQTRWRLIRNQSDEAPQRTQISHDLVHSDERRSAFKSARIELYAEAGATYATECLGHVELEEIMCLGAEGMSRDIKRRKYGLKLLERAIDAAVSHWRRDKSCPTVVWNYVTQLATGIGRNPEVWTSIRTARTRLSALDPKASDVIDQWAELIALTWATDNIGKAAAQRWDATLVPHVLLAARNARALGLERLMASRVDSATGGELSALRNEIEGKFAPEAREIESLSNLSRRALVSIDGIDAIARLSEEDRERALFDLLQDPLAAVQSVDSALNLLDSISFTNAIPCLIVLNKQLVRAHKSRVAQALSSEIAKIEAIRERTTTRMQPLASHEAIATHFFNVHIEKFRAVCAEWMTKLSLRRSHFLDVPDVPIRRIAFDEATVELEADILRLRHTLHDEANDASAIRSKLMAQMLWLEQHDPSRFLTIVSRLQDLPEEGQALLWEAGVRSRSRPLLDAVSAAWRNGGWGRRATEQLVLRFGGIDGHPLHVGSDMSIAVASRIRREIAEVRLQLHSEPPDTLIGESTTAVTEALEELRNVVARLKSAIENIEL